ncbi:DUF3501 family protein [bacterium]|jgi:hypothetical protein|nr:DUF3501 family protein [bacterium]
MSAKREITRDDILPMDQYAAERAARRKQISAVKKNRRAPVGPDATFYFENYDTMWYQIHEMLHVEKGGEEQIADELEAYNPLIPNGKELVTTMMFEIDDPDRRDRVLHQLGGVENTITLTIGDDVVQAVPENDVERTKPDGKTSSIHFLHFPLSPNQVDSFKNKAVKAVLGFSHNHYAHMAVISDAVRNSLIGDLD